MDRAPVKDLLPAVAGVLGGGPGWLVSGSVAMHLHGLTIPPRDLDIWCTDEALDGLAARLGKSTEVRRTKYFRARVFDFSMLGWEVEVSGTVELNGGARLRVDEALLARASGSPPVEAPEDLMAELLAMNREPPKNDFARACAVYDLVRGKIDAEYFQSRLRMWGVDDGLVRRLIGRGEQEPSGETRS